MLNADMLLQLRTLAGGDADFLQDLLLAFEQQCAEHLPKLQEALREGQNEERRRLSHLLKGTALNMGAAQLAAQLAVLEAGPPEYPEETIERLMDTYTRSLQLLKQAFTS